ncbi:MAG: S9 family peptidase [Candidatus Thorarchaeota archaeon]
MDLFDRIKLILETQPYIPTDISQKNNLAVGNFLTPSNASILHLTSLEKDPNAHKPILPENAFTIDAKFSPDGSWVAIPIDYTGKELSSLYRVATSFSEELPPLDKISKSEGRHGFVDWNREGGKLTWCISQETGNKVIVLSNEPDSQEKIVWEGKEIPWIGQWKPSRYIKFTAVLSAENKFQEFVIDPDSGILLHKVPIANSYTFNGSWHPQDPIFPFLSEEDTKLKLFNADSGEITSLPTPEGEIETVRWSLNGETLYFGVTKDGRDQIYSLHIPSQELKALTLPKGLNKLYEVQLFENKESIFFIHSDATTRMNLWKFDLESHEVTQLTKKRSPKVGTEDFPLVESISEHWESADGMRIHGFVLVPSNPPPPEGYPAIVYVHGGPMGQSEDTFIGTFQILTQEGFVVFLPNFRGSTGYGETFQMANYREIGKADLLDITTGVNHIVKKHGVDPNKVIIYGGSYGGYMTLRALTKPDIFKFAGGWAEAAISDWEYMYDYAPDEVFRQFVVLLFGPMENDESRPFLKESSPVQDWENVQVPLGIVQFANDTRTPLKPVWDFAQKLIERGDDVEFHVRPMMGHANIPKGYLVRSIARSIQFCKRVVE